MLIRHNVQKKVLILIVGFLCFFSSITLTNVSAQNENSNSIAAQFNVRFVTGTDLNVNVSMDIENIQLTSSITYTKSQIQALAASSERADIEMFGALKLKLRELLETQIIHSFAAAQATPLKVLPMYQNSLFYDEYSVVLTPGFFNITDTSNISSLVNGVLDMGGVTAYTMMLQAEHGWNNTYTFILPDTLGLKSSNTANVNTQQNRITWTVFNWDNHHMSETAQLSIKRKNPTTVASAEDISLVFTLDTTKILTDSLKIAIDINTMDIGGYFVLPAFITDLTFIPADGVRLFVANNLLSWDGIYQNTIKAVEQNTVSMVEISTFNQSLDTVFSWNIDTTDNCSTPFNVSSMDSEPAVRAELLDSDVDFRLCGISSRAFFGLINAGVHAVLSDDDVNFGDKLDKLDYQYEVFLHLPEKITLNGSNIYHWNNSKPLSGLFSSEYQPQPVYTQEKIDTYIEIDIKKMELNLFSFFSGNTQLTATAHLKEAENTYVGKMPLEFSLHDKINISLLNADAFRICVEEGVFTPEQIELYLGNKNVIFQERLTKLLHGSSITSVIDQTVFSDALQWDGDIFTMDDRDPVIFSAYADHVYPVNISLSVAPPSVSISDQTFELSNLGNQNVTYRIIFPNGISIKTANISTASMVKGRLSTGQEYVDVFFTGSTSNISDVLQCLLDPSPVFLLSLFLPCILTFVLLIVLIVIVYLIHKKRRFGSGPKIKKSKKSKKKTTEEESGYDGEDFYVPPPPPSSR